MPSFQLAIELSNVFPIKDVVRDAAGAAFSKAVDFARELSLSGSDLLVEEDLAVIFGRGEINHALEIRFRKDILKDTKITSLHHGCEIEIDSRPGPTVNRALTSKGPYYLATVIQLSFLGWMHGRQALASALIECITKRFQMKVQGATPTPTFDAVNRTLEACNSQTSAFPWNAYVEFVEHRIAGIYPAYQRQQDFVSLSPNMLLAAMDYLYMVQKWPEHRKMTVSTRYGFIPLVIWAHFILDLSVLVSGIPGGDITFPTHQAPSPQIIISWSHSVEQPQVCLLNSETEIVVLETNPADIRLRHINACERLPLQNFGTVMLRREFNLYRYSTAQEDPMYLEAVNLVLAMAVGSLNRLERGSHEMSSLRASTNIQRWQIYDAGALLFQDIPFNGKTVDAYAKEIGSLYDIEPPRSLSKYLLHTTPEGTRLTPSFLRLIRLATLVIVVASVSGMTKCADLPLIADLGLLELTGFAKLASTKGKVIVEESDFLYSLSLMLVGFPFISEEKLAGDTVFMVSDFGWTIYLSSMGDNDPASVIPEQLFVVRGIPTNKATGERKLRVRDVTEGGWGSSVESMMPCRKVTDRGKATYIPRCLSRVKKRTEYCGSGKDDFQASICFRINESLGTDDVPEREFGISRSYRALHQGLWVTHFSPPCEHPKDESETHTAKLGLDVAACTGMDWPEQDEGGDAEIPERICIALVKGDRQARWLVVQTADMNTKRSTMLRSNQTCEDCAVDAAADQSGKWLVVL